MSRRIVITNLCTDWITIVVNGVGHQTHVAAAAEEEHQQHCEHKHTSLGMLVTGQGEEALNGDLVDIRGLNLMQSAAHNHGQHGQTHRRIPSPPEIEFSIKFAN